MAATQTYPNFLAHGVSSGGDVPPVFELYAGDSEVKTDQAQAADAQAIVQFQVVKRDAGGKIVPWTVTDRFASGTITVVNPADTETVSVNAHAITFIATGTPTATQVLIDADDDVTAASLAAVINSDPALYAVTAEAVANVVTVVAISEGVAGNTIALAEAVADAGFTVSGATLTDAADTTDTVPSDMPIGIAAQAAAAATPGNYVPIYVAGCFNHEALVWPTGFGSLNDRKRVFDRTEIMVKQLL